MGFVDNLDALIAHRGITQEEVARAAGVTPGAVSGWRNGSTPRRGTIRRLCDSFGLTEDDLLSDAVGLAAQARAWPPVTGEASLPLVTGVDPTREARTVRPVVSVPAHVVEGRPHAFALLASDDGMSRVVPPGSHVIVDPDETRPESGSVVALKVLDLQSVDVLWASAHRVLLREWYEGATHLMLTPRSDRDDLEDMIVRLEDASASIDLLGTVVWFQSPGALR